MTCGGKFDDVNPLVIVSGLTAGPSSIRSNEWRSVVAASHICATVSAPRFKYDCTLWDIGYDGEPPRIVKRRNTGLDYMRSAE